MKRISVIIILLLAFCGLADSAYLAEHIASNTPVICNIQGLSDCNTVLGTQYSHVFGVPLADIGVLFYSILFVLAALELMMFDWFLRRILQVMAVAGVLASLYFVYLQAFVIHGFCIYCLTSALITLLVLLFSIPLEMAKRVEVVVEPVQPVTPPASKLTMPPAP